MTNINTTTYINANKSRFIDELTSFLTIPSISTQPEHKSHIQQAAQFVKEKLLAAGSDEAYLIETASNPLVYGRKTIDPQLPTVLVYGHYDVQPPEPFELWTSEPFHPVIKDNHIFARGASDDKGQVYIHIKALETMLALQQLPCNIKFLIEGEEEVGSDALTLFLQEPNNHPLLQADIVLISDTGMLSTTQPSIDTSLRGITGLEVTLTGPNRDLHSGVYGGAVNNPIHALCKIIAQLHNPDHQITIPGFYDNIAELTAEQRKQLNSIPFDLETYQQNLGITKAIGEKEYTTLERVGIRPSLDVNGIWGGYTGIGSKTIIPSKAHAKITLRLVPGQDPVKIIHALSDYLTALTPEGCHIKIEKSSQNHTAVIINEHNTAFQAAQNAFEEIWGKKPLSYREGGSIPIVSTFKEQLGLDTILMGFGLSTDNIHSPNENFSLVHFERGIKTVIAFYHHLVRLQQ
jgi:acetylornithine deacetylase/succinyl-diaminopimelate desuccinylase-like protein